MKVIKKSFACEKGFTDARRSQYKKSSGKSWNISLINHSRRKRAEAATTRNLLEVSLAKRYYLRQSRGRVNGTAE